MANDMDNEEEVNTGAESQPAEPTNQASPEEEAALREDLGKASDALVNKGVATANKDGTVSYFKEEAAATPEDLDTSADALVNKGFAKKNEDGTLSYFDEGSDYIDDTKNAGKKQTVESAEKTGVIKPGELEVKDGYSRSSEMNAIADRVRAERAAALEADKKRFTKTESTKVGDEYRSVFGSKVKYTDKDGKVTRWASLDADGNETPIDSPDSMKMQNAMNAGITSRGLDLAGKSWDDVFKAQSNEDFKKSMAYANEIADLNRMSQKEKLKRKGRFDLAIGDQMTAGLNDLDGKLQQAKKYMTAARKAEAIGGAAEEPPPFIKTENDGSQYVYGYVAGEAVNRGNERLAQRGSKNSLSGLVVKQRIDNYGNPIDEPTLVVRMNIGGNVGKSKGTKDYPFSMSQVADIISNAYQNVNGVSQEEARRRTLERLGGRNPNAWVLQKTPDEVFKQARDLKQMEIDAKNKADSREKSFAQALSAVSNMTRILSQNPVLAEKFADSEYAANWVSAVLNGIMSKVDPAEPAKKEDVGTETPVINKGDSRLAKIQKVMPGPGEGAKKTDAPKKEDTSVQAPASAQTVETSKPSKGTDDVKPESPSDESEHSKTPVQIKKADGKGNQNPVEKVRSGLKHLGKYKDWNIKSYGLRGYAGNDATIEYNRAKIEDPKKAKEMLEEFELMKKASQEMEEKGKKQKLVEIRDKVAEDAIRRGKDVEWIEEEVKRRSSPIKLIMPFH